MHAGQLTIDAAMAASLIAREFPALAGMPLTAVSGSGTVNAVFRVGADLAARFPLEATDAAALDAEARSLAEFADASPVAAPRPVGIGSGDDGYPSAWSLQTWVPGRVADPFVCAASVAFAEDVAALILALRRVPVAGRVFDGQGRGGELSDHDEWMAHCVSQSSGIVDTRRVAVLWHRLRGVPASGAHVMSHRDLTPANLLVSDGRLTGVLDAGGFGPADRSLDLVVAWHLFDEPARTRLRDAVGASEAEWLPGAGWALQQAMGLVWYYAESNPVMAELGRSTVARLLDDEEIGG